MQTPPYRPPSWQTPPLDADPYLRVKTLPSLTLRMRSVKINLCLYPMFCLHVHMPFELTGNGINDHYKSSKIFITIHVCK